jgi:hypothetical protein
MWGSWIDTAITIAVIVGAIVFIVYLFKKEVKGISPPKPLVDGLSWIFGGLKNRTTGKGTSMLEGIISALKRAARGFRGAK